MVRKAYVIGAVLAIVIVIAAVSVSTLYKPTAGPTTETTVPTQTVAELYPVKVMYVGATCEAPLMLLSTTHKDVGEKYGLDVQAAGFTSIAAYKEGMDSGKITMGAGPTYWLPSIEQGMNVGYTIAYHGGCIDLVVPAGEKGAWYKTPADLKGKTIAVGDFSDSPMYSLIKILDLNGLNSRTDVNIVVVPYADMPAALEKEQIDAFISWEPVPLIARDQGIGRIAVNMALDEPYKQYTCCYLVISKTVPEWVAVNATKAFTEEMFWVTTHKEETARLLVDNKLLLGSFEQVYEELSWFVYYPRDPMVDLPMQAESLYQGGYLRMTPTELVSKAVWRVAGIDIEALQQAYAWPDTW